MNTEPITALQAAERDHNYPCYWTRCVTNQPECIKYFIEHGWNLKETHRDGYSVLTRPKPAGPSTGAR